MRYYLRSRRVTTTLRINWLCTHIYRAGEIHSLAPTLTMWQFVDFPFHFHSQRLPNEVEMLAIYSAQAKDEEKRNVKLLQIVFKIQ